MLRDAITGINMHTNVTRTFALFLLLAAPAFGQEKPKVADKKYLMAMGSLVASTTADMWSTSKLQAIGGGERNPLFGKHPSNARLAGTSLAFTAGEAFLAYKLKARFQQSRHWYLRGLWLVEPSFQVGQHIQFAHKNIVWLLRH